MRARRALAGVLLALGVAGACAAPQAADEVGIWKAVVPRPGSMHGEFESLDPIGLTAGVKMPADCSINWTDPDTGKLYCFSSGTSLEYFLESPQAFLASARGAWRRFGGAAQ